MENGILEESDHMTTSALPLTAYNVEPKRDTEPEVTGLADTSGGEKPTEPTPSSVKSVRSGTGDMATTQPTGQAKAAASGRGDGGAVTHHGLWHKMLAGWVGLRTHCA